MSLELNAILRISMMICFLIVFNVLLFVKSKFNNLNTLLFVIVLFTVLIKTFVINK